MQSERGRNDELKSRVSAKVRKACGQKLCDHGTIGLIYGGRGIEKPTVKEVRPAGWTLGMKFVSCTLKRDIMDVSMEHPS